MPLSKLTLLRGALIVACFAFALFCLEVARMGWISAAVLFVLPLLVWMLVSNAVKEAPPFGDTAFHRTRPVTDGQVFRRLAGFHLLVLAGMLGVILIFAWFSNLAAREIVPGMLVVAVLWIALVALFATVASLSTASDRWKGWGAVTLLLLPAISLLVFSLEAWKHGWHPSWVGMPLAGAMLYPVLWWLVAAKRRWMLGCGLGLAIGLAMPWISEPFNGQGWLLSGGFPHRERELVIRRLKNPAAAEGMVDEQAEVSRSLEVHGLGADEFIAGISMDALRERSSGEAYPFDLALAQMTHTAFSADAEGRLVPATASLFHAMNAASPRENRIDPRYGLWNSLAKTGLHDLRVNYDPRRYQPDSSSIGALPWRISGVTCCWVKVLEAAAQEGRRVDLPDGGTLRLLPLGKGHTNFTIVVVRGRHRGMMFFPGPFPVLVATDAGGRTRFVEGYEPGAGREGLLTYEREYLYWEPQLSTRWDSFRNVRLEVYWPEYRGFFQATLSPP